MEKKSFVFCGVNQTKIDEMVRFREISYERRSGSNAF